MQGYFFKILIPEQSSELQYLNTTGLSEYLQFLDSRKTLPILSTSRHFMIRFWNPPPHGFEHYTEIVIFYQCIYIDPTYFSPFGNVPFGTAIYYFLYLTIFKCLRFLFQVTFIFFGKTITFNANYCSCFCCVRKAISFTNAPWT